MFRQLGTAGLLLVAVIALTACRGEKAEETPDSNTQTPVEVEATGEGVLVLRGDQPEALAVAEPVGLSQGQRVMVEDDGRVNIRLADILTAELFQPGEIGFEKLSLDEQAAAITLQQEGGVLLADFNPDDRRDHRLTLQTEFATVTTPGAQFMVVRERNAPVEWVIHLGQPEQQIGLKAGGITQTLRPDTARWVGPDAAPSEATPVDEKRLRAWFNSARDGKTDLTLSEVLFSPANLVATTEALPALPRTGQPFELERSEQGAVKLTLDSVGLFGDPGYGLEDCNGDGDEDLVVQAGKLLFDFRSLKARAMALDVTVVNRAEAGYGALWGVDPAGEELDRALLEAGPDESQTLSLRPQHPLHRAALAMVDGCFLGFSLTPPSSTGEPSEPRAAATVQPEGDVVVNILAEPEKPLSTRGQLEALPVGGDSEYGPIRIDGDPDDWNSLVARSGLDWTRFDTVTYDEACASRYPDSEAATDLLGQTHFAYDEQYLYVAFLVEDDGYVGYTGSDESYFLGDSPQLSLDIDLQGDIDEAGRSQDDWQVDFLPDLESPQVALWQLGPLVSRPFDEAQVAIASTETGYFLEAALPWQSFNVTPEAGDRLGLAANVNDNDTPGAGAQECIISTAPQRVWNDPTTWGVLLLRPTG